jgi:hypothetical protein
MSGIIYKISSDKGPKVYYGSTTQTLAQRFSDHKTHMNCSSSVLFEEYGIDNCIVEKVEEVAIDLLRERERYWIDNDENSVNIIRPWISEDERKAFEEEQKEYKKEWSREWYEKNKEYKKEWSREWYERNKEKKKEYSRSYRLKMKASADT